MRNVLASAFVLTFALAACGDDTATTTSTSGSGGAGTGGDGGATTGTTTGTTTGPTTGPTTTSSSSGGGDGGGSTTSQSSASSSSGGGDGGGGTGGGGTGGGGTGGGGTGGGGTGGGGTGGGPGDCTEITPDAFAALNAQVYGATFTPNILTADADRIQLEFYGPPDFDGDLTGSFDLTQGGDDNYATCSRCFRAIGDLAAAEPTIFFQSEGTLVVDDASDQLNGIVDATVTGLTLVEVTIDPDTFESTPVPGGACLYVASANVLVEPVVVPPEWTCDPGFYAADDGCDCDCGAYDPDCDDPAQTIFGCGAPHLPGNGPACLPDGTCESGTSSSASTTASTGTGGGVPPEWTCNPLFWDDGDCDCGCGAFDVEDCADQTVGSCEFCGNTGSCNVGPCPGTIDPVDNAVCVAGTSSASTTASTGTGGGVPGDWTCDPDFYDDGDCDCGCGAFDDLDCADQTVASCDFCGNTGSCNEGSPCPGTIDPVDNSSCTGGGGDFDITTGTVNVAIPDNDGNGVCVDLVSAGSGLVSSIESVTVALNHTWAGDLTFVLVAPEGGAVFSVIMEEPGGGNASANFASGFPITFQEGAAVSAADVGLGLASAQVICQQDGICTFAPSPEDFSFLLDTESNGTWQFCAFDSAGGDTGNIVRVDVSGTLQ